MGGLVQVLSEIVGVTYGEFQAWYNYGEIRLAAQRISLLEAQEFRKESAGVVSPMVSVVLGRLPQLSLDDEEGILLVRLKAMRREVASIGVGGWDAQTVLVPIENVEEIIPLTERARRILEPRVRGLGVRLSPAYFEAGVQDALGLRGSRRGLRGGDALMGTLFSSGSEIIDDSHRRGTALAVRLLDKRPPVDGDVRRDSQELEQWLSYAFSFTRHDPYDEGNLGYLMDAGKVLKEAWEGDSLRASDLQRYREIVRELRSSRHPEDGLQVILADSRIADFSEGLRCRNPHAFSEGLAPLVMFLRWKDVFHKNGDSVDFEGLLAETPELVASVGFRSTALGVWLLGCFAGYDGIAPEIYRAGGHGVYPWYSGPIRIVHKIGAPLPPPDGAHGISRTHQASHVPISATDSESDAGTDERVRQLECKSLVPVGEVVDPDTDKITPTAGTLPREPVDRGSEQAELQRGEAEGADVTGPAVSVAESAPGEESKVVAKTDSVVAVGVLDDGVPGLEPEAGEDSSAHERHGRRRKKPKGKRSPKSVDTEKDGGNGEPPVGNSDLFDSLPGDGSNEPGHR